MQSKVRMKCFCGVKFSLVVSLKPNMKLESRQVKLFKNSSLQKRFHENVRCQLFCHSFSSGIGDFGKRLAHYLWATEEERLHDCCKSSVSLSL